LPLQRQIMVAVDHRFTLSVAPLAAPVSLDRRHPSCRSTRNGMDTCPWPSAPSAHAGSVLPRQFSRLAQTVHRNNEHSGHKPVRRSDVLALGIRSA
jgi:hypothetical protein